MRPTAPGFSAAGAASGHRCRSSTATRSPTRSARCSIRSSASGAACGLRRVPPPGSRSRRSSRPRATRRSLWPTSTTIRQRLSARSRWRGRRPRSSYTISALTPMRRISSRISPAGSSTRTRRCGRRPQCSPAIPGGPRRSGRHGISGDLPIVLVRIDDAEDQEIVRQLLRAHEYWRMKQLAVDLVILNEQSHLLRSRSAGRLWRHRSGRASHARGTRDMNRTGTCSFCAPISCRPRIALLLQTAARAVLLSRRGTLAEQIARRQRIPGGALPLPPPRPTPQPVDVSRPGGPTSSSSTASAASLRMAVST